MRLTIFFFLEPAGLLVFSGESEGLNLGGNIRMTVNLWLP